jgi:integral membrane protein
MSSLAARPARLFGVLALAEMVTWAGLLAAMAGVYLLDGPRLMIRVSGGVHGFVFLGYALVTTLVAVDQRWPFRDLVLGLGCAVVPFATVPFERYANRRGRLGRRWQLTREAPVTPAQRVTAAAVRHPVPAALTGLVAVTVVFLVLLSLGPPTEWRS